MIFFQIFYRLKNEEESSKAILQLQGSIFHFLQCQITLKNHFKETTFFHACTLFISEIHALKYL